MIQFVLHKIRNKKWLNLCLLAGITLLAAVFTCHPMFEKGADSVLLQSAFVEYAKEKEEFPAMFSRVGEYDTKNYKTAQSIYERLQAYENKWLEYVEVDTINKQRYLRLSGDNVITSLGRENIFLNIGLIENLEDHVEIVKGVGLKESTFDVFPCLLSEKVMDATGLVVGEEITFPYSINAAGEGAKFVVTGIVKEDVNADNFWYHPLEYFDKQIFISEETFDTLVEEYGFQSIYYENYLTLDYTDINGENALSYLDYVEQFQKQDKAFSTNLTEAMKNYEGQSQTIRIILWVLELPCIVLLLLFIYMVSTQILSAEEGEIAVLRSRGVTKGQTVFLYFLQSLFLSGIGAVTGILLGYLMCKGAASTDAFLHFVKKDISLYQFHWTMILYALAACAVAIFFMTIPVWKKAEMTIVQQKSNKDVTKEKAIWERFFLDVILLLISCYFLYNHNKQKGALSLQIIRGEAIDAIMFLNASLFIFGCGLFVLRISKYSVHFIDKIGKKHWSAAMYASFIQITRTFSKQGFISIFLIMTIASGIFDAGMARTMNQNSEERIAYNIGADVVVKENWKLNVIKKPDLDELIWYYTEPEFDPYLELKEKEICDSVTKVLVDDNTEVRGSGKTLSKCCFMGISTKEFGETAELLSGSNEAHWFTYLNELAKNGNGVIISKNMAEKLDLEVGKEISYTRFAPINNGETAMATASATVCAIVEAFPGYERYSYVTDEEGTINEQENYLLVGNLGSVGNYFETTPYQIWMKMKEGVSYEKVSAYLEEKEVSISTFLSTQEQVTESKNSAMIQITNGMFTITFIISILVCSVGFLIYWIMSIRSRELMFGIYRAMGMRMTEIRHMLINEQIFGSLLPMAAGVGTGILSIVLFAKLLVIAYLPEKHNLNLQIYVQMEDMIKLFAVLLAVMFICFFILRKIVQNMKIAQALKLGED